VPGPLEVAAAYEAAWNTFDANTVGALFAEPFYARYSGNVMKDRETWSQGWPYGMARGLQMKIKLRDCQESVDSVTCTVASITDCFEMDVIETLTVKDGKIVKLDHREIPEENIRWEKYADAVEQWAAKQDPKEWQAYSAEVARGRYGYEWGSAFAEFCRKYEAAQAQIQDPTAVVAAWQNAINDGDLDAALALMTPSAEIVDWGSTRNTLDWWIDIATNDSTPNCQPQASGLVCTFKHGDDCIAAFGAPEGLPVRYSFTFQDDKIDRVVVQTVGDQWADYGEWSDKELAWAGANRAEELTKIDFDTLSQGGDSAIKLCREYAETLK
jgi:hypothetical protein